MASFVHQTDLVAVRTDEHRDFVVVVLCRDQLGGRGSEGDTIHRWAPAAACGRLQGGRIKLEQAVDIGALGLAEHRLELGLRVCQRLSASVVGTALNNRLRVPSLANECVRNATYLGPEQG